MVAVVLASRWSARRREMACRWRVAASVGCRRRSRWPSVPRSSASLQLSPGSEVALDAPQRGRAALKLLGWIGTTGWPAASSRSTTIPLVASMATGRCSGRPWPASRLMAWWMPASLWASDQRSTSWPVSSITVTSCRWLAQSHPTCRSPPPRIGHPWFTARCRGPVAACSLFGPRSGISLKAVTGPRPVGGGGPRAGCQAARGIGRPPTVTEKCGPRSYWPLPGWWTSERSRSASNDRTSQAIHRYDLGRRSTRGQGSNPHRTAAVGRPGPAGEEVYGRPKMSMMAEAKLGMATRATRARTTRPAVTERRSRQAAATAGI